MLASVFQSGVMTQQMDCLVSIIHFVNIDSNIARIERCGELLYTLVHIPRILAISNVFLLLTNFWLLLSWDEQNQTLVCGLMVTKVPFPFWIEILLSQILNRTNIGCGRKSHAVKIEPFDPLEILQDFWPQFGNKNSSSEPLWSWSCITTCWPPRI